MGTPCEATVTELWTLCTGLAQSSSFYVANGLQQELGLDSQAEAEPVLAGKQLCRQLCNVLY